MKEKFPNIRKPSHWRVCGEFWNLRGKHNWEREKNQNQKQTNKKQNACLTTTPSKEVAQMFLTTSSEWGLNALRTI